MKLANNTAGMVRCAVRAAMFARTSCLRPISSASSAQAGASQPNVPAKSRRESAFTLAETLAALVLLAIVIPVAVEALHVASGAGEVAARKGAAGRVADRILNESLVMTNWNSGPQSGTVTEGAEDFRWTLSSQNWPEDAMQLLTAQVSFSAHGHDYSVTMSTLANLQTQTTPMGATGAPGTTGGMP